MRRFIQFSFVILIVIAAAGCSSHLDLTKANTQVDVGVRAARQNLWREALFRFQRAVQIDPANAMAQNNLAVAYEGIGEFDKARLAYAEALRLDRSNQYIQKNYSRFVEFYSKNRKREKAGAPKEQTASTAAPTATAPDSGTPPTQPGEVPAATPEPPSAPVAGPADSGTPAVEPGSVPAANPEPAQTPVTTPPAATKPDSPSQRGER
jgi:tetratricopeptide repeat protein